MTSGMTRTHDEIEEIVNKLGYVLLSEYIGKGGRTVGIQNSDGYKWEGILSDLMKRSTVSFFNVSNIYTLENIQLWLNINRPYFEILDGNKYKGKGIKLKFFHNIPECQEKFEMSWDNLSHWVGCPVCYGAQVGKRNSLAYLRSDLIKEWHPNNNLTPEEVTCSSAKKVWWICSRCGYGKEYEWELRVADRTSKKYGCPSCSGRVVSDKNRLSLIYPNISLEWDYDKNSDTPNDVSFGCNEKRWWICQNGHSYFSSINNRGNGSGCKYCAEEQRESAIATELKEWCRGHFRYVDIEHMMFKNPESNHWLRCDIYLGKYNTIDGVYIEIHGLQHYGFIPRYHKTQDGFKKSKHRDKLKKEYAIKNGTYIEIDLRKIKTTEQAIEYMKITLK